jgi:GDP-4-dehydro-6-deoxy-D-mannose reductase
VGNRTTRRAIADARDLAAGLWLAPGHCEAGDVYNLGGDEIYSIDEIIDAIRGQARSGFTVVQDPALVRRCDEPVIAGDTTKFRACTGWRPKIGLTKTLGDMLEWWRRRLGRPTASEAAAVKRVKELA